MMKKLALILLIFSLFTSCEDETPGSIDRYFYTNSKLTPPENNVGMYVAWEPGDKTVFRYILNHPDEPNIADDELSEIFWIEIPTGITEFQFELGEDSPFEFYYTRQCYCYFRAFEFEAIKVEGKRINSSTWEIDFEMSARSPDLENAYELKDSGKYKLSQQ